MTFCRVCGILFVVFISADFHIKLSSFCTEMKVCTTSYSDSLFFLLERNSNQSPGVSNEQETTTGKSVILHLVW